jgi:hypothetical protein
LRKTRLASGIVGTRLVAFGDEAAAVRGRGAGETVIVETVESGWCAEGWGRDPKGWGGRRRESGFWGGEVVRKSWVGVDRVSVIRNV